MDKEDGRSDLKEMKKTAEEREDDSKTSIPQKNGVEKQIPGKEDNANANANANNKQQQQQHSDNSQDGDSKKKEISNKDDSKEKNHNSSDKNDVKNQQKDSADQKEGQSSDETKPTNVSKNDEDNDGDSAKESDSADKAENGLENKTKKQNDSGKSSQSNSSVPNTALNNNKKQETVPLQQQSSLLLAKLASQQGLKKSSPLIIGSSGNRPLSAFASSFKSNSSNFSRPPFLPKSYYSQNLNIIDEDTKLPTSSIQQIEAIRNETLLHSMSTKAQRILKAKAKAELLKKVDEKLGPLATFLNNLGLDIVKQSVYHEAIHIQSRKQQAGKLSDVECSQLDKMRSSCKELAEKLKHLKLSYRKCRLCNFVSESVNVHFWHREHPHINKREDFCCSYCDFNTRNNVAFNFHMEAEHNIKGRSMDKPSFWQCTLCPFEHNSKSKLTQHKFKCEKNFEIKTHLSPSPDTDINYSLYGVFYLSEKEEALKAIAIHKAKQAQLKAQQAQYKLQQQQAAANRANYFNANKISPIQPKPLLQSNTGQRIPVVVHPKIGSSLQSQMSGSQSNRFQSSIRQGGQSNIPIKPFSPGLSQNSNRVQSLMNQSVNKGNLNLLQSQLPVKDLINIHQAIKGQSVMTAKSMASQKLIPSNTQPTSDVSEFEICELCGGYVKDRDALRIHFFYAHRVEMPALMFEKPSPPLFCDVCDKKFWTSQGLQKHRVSLKHYAKGSLSQVCILCGCLVSHLLNHMTETHQLNLQDFLNQKRCIVCGKVCLSRSETEIHMAASHGILVKRTNANSSDTKTKSDEKGGGSPVTMVTKSGQATSGTSASQLVKGNYCVFCKVPFASNAELTQHCLLVHKACKKCGMVLPGEGSLGSHKCQISIPTVKACSVCKQEILIQEFIKHVEEKHLKKCSIKLKRLNSEDIDAGINDTKTELDSKPVTKPVTKPNASGVKEEPRKRKAEDVDLESKKRKLAAEDGAKGEAISISDSEEDEQEEEEERAEEEEERAEEEEERAEEEEERAEEEEERAEEEEEEPEEEQAEEDGGDDDDDDDVDEDEDMDDDDEEEEMKTDSLDESFEKGRKDVKGTDSSIGNKQGGADNDKHLSSKPDSECGSRWDNKNKKDNSE